jgi:hypothetical protein
VERKEDGRNTCSSAIVASKMELQVESQDRLFYGRHRNPQKREEL